MINKKDFLEIDGNIIKISEISYISHLKYTGGMNNTTYYFEIRLDNVVELPKNILDIEKIDKILKINTNIENITIEIPNENNEPINIYFKKAFQKRKDFIENIFGELFKK